jgi:hypothetical protein
MFYSFTIFFKHGITVYNRRIYLTDNQRLQDHILLAPFNNQWFMNSKIYKPFLCMKFARLLIKKENNKGKIDIPLDRIKISIFKH